MAFSLLTFFYQKKEATRDDFPVVNGKGSLYIKISYAEFKFAPEILEELLQYVNSAGLELQIRYLG